MPGWKERKHYAGICPKYLYDDEGLAGLFTAAERKAYEDARTYKAMKNRISLDSPELQAPVHALQEFFDDMNRWERMAE